MTINLRNEIPFGNYQKDHLNNSIGVFHLPITYKVEQSNDEKLNNKTFHVKSLSHTHIHLIKEKNSFAEWNILNISQPQSSGTLYFNNTPITKEDLLKELRYKNASQEFTALQNCKLQNGKYLYDYFYGQYGLHHFFAKNEENFFLLDECLNKNKFYFPKNSEDKNRLVSYIEQFNPKIVSALDSLFFSHPESTLKVTKNKL